MEHRKRYYIRRFVRQHVSRHRQLVIITMISIVAMTALLLTFNQLRNGNATVKIQYDPTITSSSISGSSNSSNSGGRSSQQRRLDPSIEDRLRRLEMKIVAGRQKAARSRRKSRQKVAAVMRRAGLGGANADDAPVSSAAESQLVRLHGFISNLVRHKERLRRFAVSQQKKKNQLRKKMKQDIRKKEAELRMRARKVRN